jgi:hypothetical protein
LNFYSADSSLSGSNKQRNCYRHDGA